MRRKKIHKLRRHGKKRNLWEVQFEYKVQQQTMPTQCSQAGKPGGKKNIMSVSTQGTSTDRTVAGKASSSGRTGSLPSLWNAQFQAIVVEGRANAHRDGQAGPRSCAAGLRSQNWRGTTMHAAVPRLMPPFTVQEAISSLRRSHACSCTGRLRVGSGCCHLFPLPDA